MTGHIHRDASGQPIKPKGFDWRAAANRCPLPPPLLLHELVARFWLPLECAIVASNNSLQGLKVAAGKRALGLMRAQAQEPTTATLPLSISTVRVVRYSPIQPDADNGASKIPVDRLLPSRLHRGRAVEGLGLILDDSPTHCRKVVEWVKAPPRKGAVLVEVWAPRDRASWELGAWTVDDVERAKALLHSIMIERAGV